MPTLQAARATVRATSAKSCPGRMWGRRLARTRWNCKNPALATRLTAFRLTHSFDRPSEGGLMRFILVMILALAAAGMARGAEEVAATVGTTAITRTELEKAIKPKLIEIESERYEALKDGLDELVAAELFKQEAAARKISPEQLEAQEITAKVAPATDPEVQQVYDANKQQLQGQTLDAVKPRIVEFLKEQKAAARKSQFIDELKGKYKTVVNLKAPVIEVGTGGRP